jgi:NADH-quinone oxidoreductase subunit L
VPINWAVVGVSLLLALGGLYLGYLLYARRPLAEGEPDPLSWLLRPVYPWLQNRYYIDEFYQATVIRSTLWLSSFFADVDARWVIDPFVNLVGRAGAALANLASDFDAKVVDQAAAGAGRFVRASGRGLRQVQTGLIQDYLLVVVVTVLLLLGIFLYW